MSFDMVVSFAKPNPGFIVYIDEAGDPGLTRIRPLDAVGSTEWLVLAGLVIRIEREAGLAAWVSEIRQSIKSTQSPALHYRTLFPDRKATVCKMIAERPVMCFAMMSNKKNMKNHKNERAEAARGASTQQHFYNWCVRLLLERVTAFVKEVSLRDYREIRHLKVVFSERGGLRYSQTKAYLDLIRNQAQSRTTFLKRREVEWEVMNAGLITSVPHHRSPGAQLADAVASSFFQATNISGQGSQDDSQARLLRPRMWEANGSYEDHGLSLLPKPYRDANLDERQKRIFRFYGFNM